MQKLPQRSQPPQICPFQSGSSESDAVHCNKSGGVCSLRLYNEDPTTGLVKVADGPDGRLRCTCPNRFKEDGWVYQWVAKTILGYDYPIVLKEIPFLESTVSRQEGREDPVGKIDNILVVPESVPLAWCALEIQAVYFSGATMDKDFEAIREHRTDSIPFPGGIRRPDYRSSGPKRLMPQLQTKVPTNCDVAWFVTGFRECRDRAQLTPHEAQFTTLEDSVEGLTAGVPVSRSHDKSRAISNSFLFL